MRISFKALCEECDTINERLQKCHVSAQEIIGTLGVKSMNRAYAVVEYINAGRAYRTVGDFGTASEAAKILRGISYGLGRCGR